MQFISVQLVLWPPARLARDPAEEVVAAAGMFTSDAHPFSLFIVLDIAC